MSATLDERILAGLSFFCSVAAFKFREHGLLYHAAMYGFGSSWLSAHDGISRHHASGKRNGGAESATRKRHCI